MDFRMIPGALERLERSAETREVIEEAAKVVRDRARQNARPIAPDRVDGIVAESGQDEKGVYADVGYDKTHPGFVLWWHEVGTSQHPASPHLRPALNRRID